MPSLTGRLQCLLVGLKSTNQLNPQKIFWGFFLSYGITITTKFYQNFFCLCFVKLFAMCYTRGCEKSPEKLL